MRLSRNRLGALLVGLGTLTACSSADDTSGTGSPMTDAGSFANGGAQGNGGSATGGAITAPPTCNNGALDPGEDCDGQNLGGASCASATMNAASTGSLRCTASCVLDTTGCSQPAGNSDGGLGAGGGPGIPPAAGGGPGTGGTAGGGGTTATTGGTTGAGGTTTSTGGTAGTGGGTAGTGETGRMVGMTAAINDIRHQVQTPTPLPDMVWDPDIAAIAQSYAETLASQGCNLVHSGRAGYGENLAWFKNQTPPPSSVAQLWAGELACYTYGPFKTGDVCTSACDASGGCGHYTQLVWRNTTKVGCGVASCGSTEVWVCNFQPPGNFVGQLPY